MSLHELLSTRTRNALVRYFRGQAEVLNDPRIIAGMGPQRVSCVTGVGQRCLKEIAFALLKLGTIGKGDPWLHPYRDQPK